MTTLAQAFTQVEKANDAHDLFNGDTDKAKTLYRELASLLHPDKVPDKQQLRATRAMSKLTTLWSAYSGGAAAPVSTVIQSRTRAYVVGDKVAEGDIASLFNAQYQDNGTTTDAIAKIVRSPTNNDLMENEAKVLRHLADKMDPAGLPYVTQLIDSFKYRDGGADRVGNVLTRLDGWHTLREVREAYPQGLDVRDVMWMWKRLLIGIGHAHRAGVVHGAVTPDHVLIEPELHGVCLADWCYATIEREATTTTSLDPFSWQQVDVHDPGGFDRLRAFVPQWKGLYPPELDAKEPVSAATDIYMASKTISTLFNRETPKAFRAFIRGCVDSRPVDAWALMQELTDLSFEHFGPRVFRPFSLNKGGSR